MSDIGEVSGAVKSVTDLISGILERSDRDGPEKQYNESLVKIQNAFVHNSLDSDDFRIFVDQLCNQAGISLTPTGDVPTGRREYLHASLCIIAQAVRDRELLTKAIVALQNKNT